ncbi:MAG: hypothetical protein KAJ63_13385, partial [Methyloprofundus sp.]|nr:hypothetical protein [Methyloprofundus sp.]
QTQEKQALEAKQKQAEALQTEVKQYEQKSIEHEQENQLMLLQLHQVQEELEHYFKKHQALEADIQSHGAIAFIEQRQDTRLAINAQLIQVTQEAEGLRVDLINLQWQEQTWPKYHLQIIKPSFIYGQNTATAAIKLPLQEGNLLPLKAWPPQTADEQGPYWMIDENLLRVEQEHSHLDVEDIGFLHALICQLPDWLRLTKAVNVNNSWEEYYLAIDSLKPDLDVVFNLHDV